MQQFDLESSSDSEESVNAVYETDLKLLNEMNDNVLSESWKSNKTSLLTKMLELEEPSITPKMVDYLLQEGVCETLLGFITQIGTETRSDEPSESMKLSYRATMLLSADDPSDTLLAFVSKRSGLMARHAFEIFRDDSAGSFHHAHRLLEFLLRHYPGEVYEGLVSDGMLASRMTAMLRYIGHAPVGDMLVALVCLTPVSRTR